jgi:hypothetical protein
MPAPQISSASTPESQHKPVGFDSSETAGPPWAPGRLHMITQVVTTLKMMPLSGAVSIPFVPQSLDAERRFEATEILGRAPDAIVEESAGSHGAMQPLRNELPAS